LRRNVPDKGLVNFAEPTVWGPAKVRLCARFRLSVVLWVTDVVHPGGGLAMAFQSLADGRFTTYVPIGFLMVPGHPHFPYGIDVLPDLP
jgi:hypothetical protein